MHDFFSTLPDLDVANFATKVMAVSRKGKRCSGLRLPRNIKTRAPSKARERECCGHSVLDCKRACVDLSLPKDHTIWPCYISYPMGSSNRDLSESDIGQASEIQFSIFDVNGD